MRHDLNNEDGTDEYDVILDDETVKKIQEHLKADPRKRAVEIGSFLRLMLILMLISAIIGLVYYYGTMMYKSYQFGEKYKSRYDNIIKENE